MEQQLAIDHDAAWQAVLARDKSRDGSFVTGVLTTGIYCRPSCAARHPKRENVRFFASGAEAAAAGLRACLRCRPDEVSRDAAALERLRADRPGGDAAALDALAALRLLAYHFTIVQARDRRTPPLTPAERSHEHDPPPCAMAASPTPSTMSVYSGRAASTPTPRRVGMTPRPARRGAGRAIRGAQRYRARHDLVAGTARALPPSLDEDESELRRAFPCLIERAAPVGGLLGARSRGQRAQRPTISLEVRGPILEASARAVADPAGLEPDYAGMGRGGKRARPAAGTACGQKRIAVLIPCHRARRGDGSPGGYAYGLHRKAALLEREAG